jgi:hypothetical protein
MRIFIALALALSACAPAATGPGGHVNVAVIKNQISDQIKAETGDRKITSMGKTTADRATVYTTNAAGVRQEETWSKASGGWKLETKSAMN